VRPGEHGSATVKAPIGSFTARTKLSPRAVMVEAGNREEVPPTASSEAAGISDLPGRRGCQALISLINLPHPALTL